MTILQLANRLHEINVQERVKNYAKRENLLDALNDSIKESHLECLWDATGREWAIYDTRILQREDVNGG